LPSPRLRTLFARSYTLSLPLALSSLLASQSALAEKVIAKGDDWQVYTDGRVGAFASWVYGQGYPQNTYDADGNLLHDAQGGGWRAAIEQGPPNGKQPDQGTINSMRLRSGFIGNQLGVGVRGQVTPWTTVTGYIQIWAWVESSGRIKNQLNYADVRQGYAKLEGPWGSFLAGRTRALFSRGATDIDSLYAHRWGVGFPGNIDSNGPTLGQIGFGVLGSGFAAGAIYATPVIRGFQLSVGAFDPIQLQGNGAYNRTKYVRPEFELTFERRFAETGKVVLFGNGAYQKIYKDGYDPNSVQDQTAAGLGYGGRFELGPLRLGAAGHFGKGLGFNYALEPSDAAVDQSGILRKVDGYYVQGQLVINKFDLFAGWGMVRAFLTDYDKNTPTHSIIKNQMGINAGVVYNVTPNVHIDLDYFRAKAEWWLGESQTLNVTNAGMTFNW
jgi:hypothetical protein